MDRSPRKAEIRQELERVRRRTLWLLESVPEAFFKTRVHDFYSPVGWHFGHVGMTEEFWVQTQALQHPALDSALSFLFANLPENPKDNRVYLPSQEEIVAYLAATRYQTLQALDETDLDSPEPLLADGYAWEFAIQHECQHQETITELLQLIQKQSAVPDLPAAPFAPATATTEMLSLPGGTFVMGSDDRHGYDNEKDAHSRTVAPFELDRTPVTSAQWLTFMEDAGYCDPRLWQNEGFQAWVVPNRISAPEYWLPTRDAEAGYLYVGPHGVRPIDPNEPVCGISWYEADAYARWIGKRLPTEVEWEYAAAYDSESGQTRKYPWGENQAEAPHASFGLSDWKPAAVGTHPQGASAFGLEDMAGGVWEWTSSPFLPYPGFQAFPYNGYSLEHMDGTHRVCRGGSWATSARLLRCSFRNWYVPTYRQGFLGLRCAR